MADHFQLRLVDSYMLAPSVRHLVFERDGRPAAGVPCPGSSCRCISTTTTAQPTKRSYSVATVGDEAVRRCEQIEIAVSYVDGGAATSCWASSSTAARSRPAAPTAASACMEADTNPRYLLLATGTGVTPYRAMLPQHRASCWRAGIAKWCCSTARATKPSCSTARSSRHSPMPTRASSSIRCLSRQRAPTPRRTDRSGHVQNVLAELGPSPSATSPTCAAIPTWSTRLRGAEGSRPAGEAHPPREIRLLALRPLRYRRRHWAARGLGGEQGWSRAELAAWLVCRGRSPTRSRPAVRSVSALGSQDSGIVW